ncbi:MAG: response regulator [Lachnospiraceae bacterium]|nr:response regulator [Lachnospiraceae bacterium]
MKILLVDDEKISLENLADAVSSAKPDAELHAFLHADEALAFAARVKFDIAILDISMRDMDGIETAEKLRMISPNINIIFATGYSEYMPDAFSMHASGYMMKPITAAKVLRELSDLRHPVRDHVSGPKRVRIQTFGNFEVFIDEQPVRFQYNKTREMLAYLTDRSGAFVTNGELMGILWEDSPDTSSHSSYLRNLKTDLTTTFASLGCGDVIVRQRSMIAILPDKVDCDYYDWKNGDPRAKSAYFGEYMSQYGWAEFTHGRIS